MIFKPWLGHILLMTLDARFVLDWENDVRGLLLQTRVMFECVPCRQRENGRSPQNSFADMAIDAAYVFRPMME